MHHDVNMQEFFSQLARSNEAYDRARDEVTFCDHYETPPSVEEQNRTAEGIIFGIGVGSVMWLGIFSFLKLAGVV
jgi:hypothetical protein